MGYPNIIFGRYGDEKVAQSTSFGVPLGAKMILPDGREYVHAYANTGAALAVGTPVLQKVGGGLAGSTENLAVATAATIGATSVVLTMPAGTTVCTVVDQYAGGYLFVTNDTGQGYNYKIRKSSTAAAASTATFTLEVTDPIVVALAAGTSDCCVRENAFWGVIERPAGTASGGIPAGVPNDAVSAGFYCWLQRKGEVNVLSGGTITETGRPFACCTVEASFQAWDLILAAATSTSGTTLSPVGEIWGYCTLAAGATTDYMSGYLTLP